VIGLLTTQLLAGQGIEVLAVDAIPRPPGVGEQVRRHPGAGRRRRGLTVWQQTDGRGADRVIELTGAYPALHEAIRCAGVDGTVVAGGFYQGPATALRLGEEFHHNRVRLVPVPDRRCADRAPAPLDPPAAGLDRDAACARGPAGPAAAGHPRAPAEQAAEAYTLLDDPPADLLQVILDFRAECRMSTERRVARDRSRLDDQARHRRRPPSVRPSVASARRKAGSDGLERARGAGEMRHPVRLAVQEQYLQGDTMTAKWEHAQRLGFDAIELRGAGRAGSRPGCRS
jgi:hypothetical protein